MLRAVSDGDIIGAGTMSAERDYTCHVFSQELEDARVAAGMQPVPWNIISSLDATDIPFIQDQRGSGYDQHLRSRNSSDQREDGRRLYHNRTGEG